ADASLDACGGGPVCGKELAQRTGCRIDEFFLRKSGEAVGHAAPGRIVVDGEPGERGFEEMHVRVRALRQSSVAVGVKAAERMGIVLLECRAQRCRLPAPAVGLAEYAVPAGTGEESEGLVVEIEARILDAAVETPDRRHDCLGADEVLAKIVERVPRGLAPRAVPAEPAGLAVAKRLTRDRSCAVRPREGSAVEVVGLGKSAVSTIRAERPPQRQRRRAQAVSQRRRLTSR